MVRRGGDVGPSRPPTVGATLAWSLKSIVNHPARTLSGGVLVGMVATAVALLAVQVPRAAVIPLLMAGALIAIAVSVWHSRMLARHLLDIELGAPAPLLVGRAYAHALASCALLYAGISSTAHYLSYGTFLHLVLAVVSTWIAIAIAGIAGMSWPAAATGTRADIREAIGVAVSNLGFSMRLAFALAVCAALSTVLVIALVTVFPTLMQLMLLHGAATARDAT